MTEPARSEFRALGTGCVVLAADPTRAHLATSVVRDHVAELDAACSRFRGDSELERVNGAGGSPQVVGDLLLDAVDVALRGARLTDGDLDPTIGQALRVLGYDRDFADLSGGAAAVLTVARVAGWRSVRLDRDRSTITIPRGVRLDLGATAKAFGADRAAEAAAAATGSGVLVSLGGDIATAGAAPAGGWVVGIADSRHAATAAELGTAVTITSGGLATSSTTVRTWDAGGERRHHILDPSTSLPAEVVWRTVSVAASTCVDANIASTTAVIRGEAATGWLADIGLPARLVRLDGSVVRVGRWPDGGGVR